MGAIIKRHRDENGNPLYYITSSAAVGMSDGSGNLDKKLANLEADYTNKTDSIKEALSLTDKGVDRINLSEYIISSSNNKGLNGIGQLVTGAFYTTESFLPLSNTGIEILKSSGTQANIRRVCLYLNKSENSFVKAIDSTNSVSTDQYDGANFFRFDSTETISTLYVKGTWSKLESELLVFDKEPTLGSTKAVESGGVFTSIKDMSDILGIEETTINKLSVSAYSPTFSGLNGAGQLVSSSFNCTNDFIPIGNSSNIKIVDKSELDVTIRRICLYSENNQDTWIANVESSNSFVTSNYPSAKYFRFDTGKSDVQNLQDLSTYQIIGTWNKKASAKLERDEIPTESSKKLVESGGVFNSIRNSEENTINSLIHKGSYNVLENNWDFGLLNGLGQPTGEDNGYSSSKVVSLIGGINYIFCNEEGRQFINRYALYRDEDCTDVIMVSNYNLNVDTIKSDITCFCKISVAVKTSNVEAKKYMLLQEKVLNSLKNLSYIPFDKNKSYIQPDIKIFDTNIEQSGQSSAGTNKPIELYAYSSAEYANGAVDDNQKIFVGYSGNINAIQRAINAVPNETSQEYIIYMIGKFEVTEYDKMSTFIDVVEPKYRCFISLYQKRNITLSGVGNRETKIIVSLPETFENENGINIPTLVYHPLEVRNTQNCKFKNFSITGHNIRYTIHINGLEQVYQSIEFDNVDIDYISNSGDHIDWVGAKVGCDIADGLKLKFKYCLGASLIGHYTTQGKGSPKVTFIGCINPTMGIKPKINEPSVVSVAEVEYIANNMSGYASIDSDTTNNTTLKQIITGYGNVRPMIRKPTNNDIHVADIVYNFNKNTPIGNLVDEYGDNANGRIFGIVVKSTDGIITAYRNMRYAIAGQINCAADYTPKKGDYCIAENGLLKKVDYMTNAIVVDISGSLWLLIE